MSSDCTTFCVETFIGLVDDVMSKTNIKLYERVKVKKGEVVIPASDITNYFCFVESGILRSYTKLRNKDKTLHISFQGEFLGFSFGVDCHNADVTVCAVVPSTVLVFNWKLWFSCSKDYPELCFYEKCFYYYTAKIVNQRLVDALHLSAYERYLKLIKSRPEFIQYVPLIYISDYIGCSVENLSRIRRMI